MHFVRTIVVSFLLLITSNIQAATDPVTWSLFPATGFASTATGSISSVVYTLTNTLPRPAKLVTNFARKGGNFYTLDLCNNQTIAPNASCSIFNLFVPIKAGQASMQLTYGYHNNRIPLPTLIATATGQGGELIVGSITGLPPAFTLSNPEQRPTFSVTYTNVGTTDVIGYAGDSGGLNLLTSTPSTVATVAVTSNSCGTFGSPVTLNQGQSCIVEGQLTPVSLGTVNVSGLFTYDSGSKTSTPSATSTVISGGSTCLVHGHVLLPLPANTYKYADNVVKFSFENECNTGSVELGQVVITSNSSPAATITTNPTYDLCSNKILGPNESCSVTASVIPKATGSLTVTASVNQVTATTGSDVASNIQAQHHILFVNQCPFNVWYGIQNGDGGSLPTSKSPDPNIAKYSPNVPPTSAYLLAAQVQGSVPSIIDLTTSKYINGKLWPRTGCTLQAGQFNCAIGTCATLSNSGACVTTGNSLANPQSPNTLFEATLNSAPGTDGVYDVSIINGMTVPVEVKAFGPTTGNTSSNIYNCSAAGAIIQPSTNSNLGACSWSFDPSSTLSSITNVNNDFYWVTPGVDDACTNATGCGMAYTTSPSSVNPGGVPINRRVGNFLGYNPLTNNVGFTDRCQWGSLNLFTKYSMGVQIAGQTMSNNYGTSFVLGSNTYNAYNVLLACTPDSTASSGDSADSCFQTLNGAQFLQCCGCLNWDGVTLPSAQCGSKGTGYLPGDNLDWTTNAIPMTDGTNSGICTDPYTPGPIGSTYTIANAVSWLKYGCPTAYVYQFDDPSSSFQCTEDSGVKLTTSYQVTFCPGGLTGLPSGLTDGRSTPP